MTLKNEGGIPVRRKIICILLCFAVFCGLSSCKEKDDYRCQGQNAEKMIALFQQDPEMFQEIAVIFINNRAFWEKARRYEDDVHAFLMSPNETEKMHTFSEDEQAAIRTFFEKTTPYMIIVNAEPYFVIDYVNEERTAGFTFAYYYGDKTTKTDSGTTEYEDWVFLYKHRYTDFRDLGNDWFFYAA